MSLFSIPILSELIGIGRTWLQGKQKVQEATDNRKATIIQNEASWDQIMAKASESSWKDEFWCIVLSIPLILGFIPGCEPTVTEGFVALERMPDWYGYLLSVCIAASFGVKKAIGVIRAKAK